MASVTISMRLSREEALMLEEQARQTGIGKADFLRQALRRGARDLALEAACEAFRRRQVTLSRAAEMAGISLREMILEMRDHGLELDYGTEELAADLGE